MNPVPDEAANHPTSRREWSIALALIGCGVAVRLWVASRSAVEHFDEGVYASNLFFGEPEFAYPMQHLYAPPLLPSLIETGMIAGLPPNLAAILPSLLAGCAMLVAVWRIGRRWFGPAAGIASLALAALSDFHIVYSSTALTDVLLTLFVLLAVGATARGMAWAMREGSPDPPLPAVDRAVKASGRKRNERRVATPAASQPAANQPGVAASLRGNLVDKWVMIAGLLTAAAWWTKYNGWLPLAIAVTGAVFLMVVSRTARQRWQRLLLGVVLIGATAAVAWSPVPLGLGDVGGYAAVAANHANYVVGPTGWLGSAARQIANQSAMEGALSWLSVGVAMAGVWVLFGRKEQRAGFGIHYWGLAAAGLLTLAAVVESTFVVLLVLSAATLAGLAWDFVGGRGERRLTESQIGLCLVLAWFGGLVVATPNYYPYPRLAMPLLACLWLAAGSGLATLARADAAWPGAIGRISKFPLGRIVAAGLLAGLPLAYVARAPIESPWGSLEVNRTGMRRAALDLAARIQNDLSRSNSDPLCFIFVQAEPAMVFQLRAIGFPFVQPTIAPPPGPIVFQGEAIPTYFIYGPHAGRDGEFAEAWREAEAGFLPLSPGGVDSRPSPVVLLDSNDPRLPMPAAERVWLYRIRNSTPAENEPEAGDSRAKSGFDTPAQGGYSSALPPERRTPVAHGGLPVSQPASPCPAPLPSEPPSVLLVESSAEEREVLRFALQRRGLKIFEADEAEAGLRLAERHQPRVIVLDLEAEDADREDVRARFDAASAEHRSSLVILGRARRYDALPREQVLAKPYHFGPLVETIEQLAGKAA